MTLTKVCPTCKKEFSKPYTCSIKNWETRKKYCSKECLNKSKLGKPSWNKGTVGICKPNSSSFKKGNKSWNEGLCGKDSHMFGKKRPKETIEKLSGPNCNFWKGGITPLRVQIRNCKKYDEWRLQVFGRDNFTCQHCGARGTYFEAHHKKRFTDILTEYNITTLEQALECNDLWDILNGITLCSDCHEKIPKNTKGD